tara:strand:+ start:79 stop:279 length:201 start_codon:yes stop_codon:yes gene_type:complete
MKSILNKEEYQHFVKSVDFLRQEHDFEVHYVVTFMGNGDTFEVELLNIEEDDIKNIDKILDTGLEE